MILVVAPRGDVHAAAVLRGLAERDAEAVQLDLSRFPRAGTVAPAFEGGRSAFTVRDGPPPNVVY